MKKKIIISLFSLCVFALKVSAQTTKDTAAVFTIADSASFTGKYMYEDMPFKYMEVSVKNGKLYYSGGEYSGILDPLKNRKDAFDAGGVAVFTFMRNNENNVAELKIDYQGQSYVGKREDKKN